MTRIRISIAVAVFLLPLHAAAGADETVRLPAVADDGVVGGSLADRNDSAAESMKLSGYIFDPSPPGVAVRPAPPRDGDTPSIKITHLSTTGDGKPIRYNYLWHLRQGRRLNLTRKGASAELGRPVKAGERWRVFVVANAAGGKAAMTWIEFGVIDRQATPSPADAPRTSGSGQFIQRRGYVSFDISRLAGKTVRSARLALYARPDVSWKRKAIDTSILIYPVARKRARFDESRLTWANQPLTVLPAKPIAKIDLPGMTVTESHPKWRAWSTLNGAAWKDRGRHANAFSNDPTHGVWSWREVDVTAAVKRSLTGAGRVTFCLASPPRTTDSSAACSVRTREYLAGRCAPVLIVVLGVPNAR